MGHPPRDTHHGTPSTGHPACGDNAALPLGPACDTPSRTTCGTQRVTACHPVESPPSQGLRARHFPVPKGNREWLCGHSLSRSLFCARWRWDDRVQPPSASQCLPVPPSPSCSCLMAPTAVAFILSWWLAARGRAQRPRQPFLSLHPSKGVALGDSVTLRCHLPRPALWVLLYRNEARILHQYSTGEQNRTEFFFGDVQREHAATYRCQYEDKETTELSALSDPVELAVTDASFPLPGTMLSPSGRVETGTDVTVRCWAPHGATFLLHKDGCPPPSQRQDPQGGDTATFTLPGVTPADAGTYRCSYIPRGYPFLSSPLGDKVTLEVTPASGAPRGTEGGPRRTLLVAVGGGCAATAALVFSLGLFFLLTARRRRRGASPQGLGATELQVPPRDPWPQEDSERLTYAELRPPAPGPPRMLAAPQPPIIYAQVGAGGPH